MIKRISVALLTSLTLQTYAWSQTDDNAIKHIDEGVEYKTEIQTSFSHNNTPLWLNANKYGLSSIKSNNGYIRAAIARPIENDSARNWRLGYGIDLVGAYDYTSSFIVQQLYAEAQYKLVRFSLGSKERDAEQKNRFLSSGSQTFGINARPIPEARFELDYWNISGEANWAAIKGHIGYGLLTDDAWQKSVASPSAKRQENVFYHSKAGYLRLGNEEKFPIVFEGGLELASTFGGNAYNTRISIPNNHMSSRPKDFLNALIMGGSDPTDGAFLNASGNMLGSWLLSLSAKIGKFKVRAYYDHFFEDHSMMFFQFGWKDGLIGTEITLPENPFVSSFVYEYIGTKYQSGPVYHDGNDVIEDQISAIDNYYNHGIYNGWQHWGQAIGNPLYTSSIYNTDGTLEFKSNRFFAHHIGFMGQPLPELNYRFLITYTEHWGCYYIPYQDKKYATSMMLETSYTPKHIGKLNTEGWKATLGLGIDLGNQLNKNNGVQLTISKTGLLSKTRK